MTDGRVRGALKRLVRAYWALDVGLRRRLGGQRGRYALGGDCRSCANCCEAPAIRVSWTFWYLPLLRRVFVAWQRRVNGFVLDRAERAERTFVFRCTHFDTATRRCDSYATRPFMCADYPRLLLEQPWPDFFEGCGHHAVARGAAGLRAALAATGMPPEKRAALAKKLHVVE